MAVHVVDALFICGTDVRQLHYNERFICILMLIAVCNRHICFLLNLFYYCDVWQYTNRSR